ncbi:type II secretion system F family protein [Nocardioides sp. B-3]|uniref:type II secretion system F family protein n=1 Tax=Nocardioides sp. B-3 TaxID=2895565 RepID=UPI002153493B|nr:type II secretion system F family protein [Nocardioides sp. B-3]UUZ59712.1 type II secretion system F family protein [Nocardioides sp. B-3]
MTGAGSSLTAAEWVLLHAAMAISTAAIFFFLLGGAMGVLGLLLGIVVPWVYLKWRHGRRLAAFNAQLAETLGLMAGGLRAGLSLPQAVDTVVREGNEPMASELRRALVEQRLGVEITDALEGVGERMESEDFDWVVMAVRIQREVGGNLAEILHTVAGTLREREYLRRQVKALSAEGRLSGYILTGLPRSSACTCTSSTASTSSCSTPPSPGTSCWPSW